MVSASAVPILMYHHVSPEPGLVTVRPAYFQAQMAWLAKQGWMTLTLDQLAGFLTGKPVPKKSVVITFDDGYLDNWVYAHPVLEQFGLHGSIFLITGQLGYGTPRSHAAQGKPTKVLNHSQCKQALSVGRADDVMLRWSEISAMRAAGSFEFHSHTHTHTRWDQVVLNPHDREDQLAKDLDASANCLRVNLGDTTPHLCWPQGYYDDNYLSIGQTCGFRYFYTTAAGTTSPGSNALQIPRIVVKDRPAGWLERRLAIYSRPRFAHFYDAMKSVGRSLR